MREIQGNLVQPHGRPCTTLWFFKFPAEWSSGRCRDYLKSSSAQVTTALTIWTDRGARRASGNEIQGIFRSLALTSAGMKRADVSNPEENV